MRAVAKRGGDVVDGRRRRAVRARSIEKSASAIPLLERCHAGEGRGARRTLVAFAMDAVAPALLAASCVGLFVTLRRPRVQHGGPDAEGIAIDADKFWLSARRRKAAFVGICALEAATRMFGLAWHASFDDGRRAMADGILAAFWTIALAIAVRALSTRNTARHWRAIVALAALGSLASIASVNELLNSALRRLRNGVTASNEADIVLVGVNTLLSLVATWVIATAPGGPPRFYSKSRLAGSQPPVALATAATDPTKANVTPLVEASPLAFVAFNWATPIVRLGARIDPSNLPLVQASLRARVLYEQAKASAGPSLLRRILRINRTLVITQFVLAIIAAVLYYAPAYFLQQVIRYLEQRAADPEHPPPYAEGLATCFGLFFALLLDTLTQGQLCASRSAMAPLIVQTTSATRSSRPRCARSSTRSSSTRRCGARTRRSPRAPQPAPTRPRRRLGRPSPPSSPSRHDQGGRRRRVRPRRATR